MDDGNWKVACRACRMTNVNIVLDKLATEGIPAKLEYEAVGSSYGIMLEGLGEVEVLVPEGFLEQASEIL